MVFPVLNPKLDDFPILFGADALRILKRKPQNGYEFLPKTIGRGNTSFHTSQNITTPEFFALMWMDYILDHGNTNGLTFAVPSYWTDIQKASLANSLKLYRMPLEAIVDDVEAVTAHYAATRYTRYQKKTRNVLFVDFGATSFKVYGITFQWNRKGQFSIANETANEWSEKVGGYYCAKVVAAKENISIKKATQRIIQDSNRYLYLFKNQTVIIETLLKRALSRLQHQTKFAKFEKNSFQVDEVQLIGGASKMPFLRQLIINITNCTNILRDFNLNEEISVGTVYCVQNHRGLSKTPVVFLGRLTPLTYSVRCDGYRSVCDRGNKCKDNVRFDHWGCDVLDVVGKEDEMPEGSPRILSTYKLLNISDMNFTRGQKGIGIVQMAKTGEAKIEGVTWCKGTECYPIAAQYNEHPNPEMKHGLKFLTAFSKGENERRKKTKYIEDINLYLSFFDLENFDTFPPDIKWILNPWKAYLEMGTLRSLTVDELKEGAQTLRDLVISTLPHVQVPDPTPERDYVQMQTPEEAAPTEETIQSQENIQADEAESYQQEQNEQTEL